MRIIVAHVFGLCVTGISDTIGTTSGFSIGGAGIGLFLGGILSTPWMAALGLLIWFKSAPIEGHPIKFAIAGPALVIGSWALLSGSGGFLQEVAISAISSSLLYLTLVFAPHLLRAGCRARLRHFG